MSEIKCPYDLNQFILGEPIFENPFSEEECEKRKFYGDCYHCFSTAIAARDHQLKASVTAQQKVGRCKDCKYFEYDSVAKVDGIPLIVAHEICKRWGDGCKSKEDGYCFLFEPQAEGSEE